RLSEVVDGRPSEFPEPGFDGPGKVGDRWASEPFVRETKCRRIKRLRRYGLKLRQFPHMRDSHIIPQKVSQSMQRGELDAIGFGQCGDAHSMDFHLCATIPELLDAGAFDSVT